MYEDSLLACLEALEKVQAGADTAIGFVAGSLLVLLIWFIIENVEVVLEPPDGKGPPGITQ